MPQIVEYNGARIEFPDGMPPAEIEATIKRSALSLPGKSKAATQVANDAITQGAMDPTASMSTTDKFLAGAGKAFVDLGRGVGQLGAGVADVLSPRRQSITSLVTGQKTPSRVDEMRAEVADSRKRDAALMHTTPGFLGNLTGNVAALLPTALLPGANTITGAGVIGALSGLAQPSTSTGETATNTVLGGIAAPAAIGLARGAQALYQGAKGLIEPLTASGQERIAADVLRRSATDPAKAAQFASQARELVPGSQPTLAQVAQDPGLAQLERTVLNNPEYAGSLQNRFANQRQARVEAIKDVAGRGDHYDDIAAGRALFAKEDYAKAMEQGIDPRAAQAFMPQIQSLMERPSIQAAQRDAIRLAKENGVALNESTAGSLQGLDWIKKALDNKISIASNPGSSIGKEDLRALLQTKADLMATMEQLSPAYKAANSNYAAMSQQVNSMDVARGLLDKLNKPGSEYMQKGSAKEMGDAYMRALSESKESVKKVTGMNLGIGDVMAPRDVAALENVARDLGRKSFAENAGKATGSNTAQNLASQNMLRRMLGPTGLPETWAESSMLQGLLSPVQVASKMTGADKRIMDRIATSLLDPADGIGLLSAPATIPNIALLGAPATQRYLPAMGLLPLMAGK